MLNKFIRDIFDIGSYTIFFPSCVVTEQSELALRANLGKHLQFTSIGSVKNQHNWE